MLKIHESSAATGELSAVYLRADGAALELVTDERAWALPEGALAAVLSKFGAPFDDEARIDVVAELELSGGERLRHVRHLAGYDVIARDYLVHERADGEPLCAMSTTVAAALMHLARAAAAR